MTEAVKQRLGQLSLSRGTSCVGCREQENVAVTMQEVTIHDR
jgi:hypothetical protein